MVSFFYFFFVPISISLFVREGFASILRSVLAVGYSLLQKGVPSRKQF